MTYTPMTYMEMLEAQRKRQLYIDKYGRPKNACRFCGESNYHTVDIEYTVKACNWWPSKTPPEKKDDGITIGKEWASDPVCDRCHPLAT